MTNTWAFTTRTASFIIQEHFPPKDDNRPGGPLYGEQRPAAVLVSRTTVSAPEEFAYNMKALRRGLIDAVHGALTPLVDAGTLTTSQADAVVAALEEALGTLAATPSFRPSITAWASRAGSERCRSSS